MPGFMPRFVGLAERDYRGIKPLLQGRLSDTGGRNKRDLCRDNVERSADRDYRGINPGINPLLQFSIKAAGGFLRPDRGSKPAEARLEFLT
jgi:hypothetical protein